ncbi:hypothetical protein jhhlp_007404 [Lomentospora prolificans]|uniref:Uncharacterized protein n=1 Tax=Lomentospora prolificans TaxID=41688 RepID=A0A2N3N2K6_9PEZI|nr:hypothetical protein jhhlp_007404 [Lomentospora prolificans]
MPSVTSERSPLPSCKKRRREDADYDTDNVAQPASQRPYTILDCPKSPFGVLQTPSANTPFYAAIPSEKWQVATRKIIPLPSVKRARVIPGDGSPERNRRAAKSPSGTPGALTDRDGNSTTTGARQAPTPRTSLSPCHICHRRPTKKSDLDSFADCQGCGNRTCFVCIRECRGWSATGNDESCMSEDTGVLSEQEVLSRSFHMDDAPPQQDYCAKEEGKPSGSDGWAASGHRNVVCSRCCVETGADGDIACLGCLSRMEGA